MTTDSTYIPCHLHQLRDEDQPANHSRDWPIVGGSVTVNLCDPCLAEFEESQEVRRSVMLFALDEARSPSDEKPPRSPLWYGRS